MYPIVEKFKQESSGCCIKDSYKILHKIGSGSTSHIKKVKHRDTGKYFAVKILNK